MVRKTQDEKGDMTGKTLKDYKWAINRLKKHGYKPIAVTTMCCENTFCFATTKEAKRAYDFFEKRENANSFKDYVDGWWYGKKGFLEATNNWYPNFIGYKPTVFWL